MDESKFWPNWEATRPSKLSEISPEEIQNYYDYFAEAHAAIRGHQDVTHAAAARMVSLRNYLDQRHIDDHHSQAQRLGRKTLFWAKVGGIAAVVGTLVLLGQDIHISKFLPSKSSKASPTSSPQAAPSALPSETPTATESPSATPLESPTPQAEK